MTREKMWFGTLDYMTWIEPPKSGADSSPANWSADGTLLNGGGYAYGSINSHKVYNYAWSAASKREDAQLMKDFADGVFGRGKVYFIEPNIYETNVLPARWATPSMTCDYEGPSLVPGVDPQAVPTSVSERLRLPTTAALYDLTNTDPVTTSTTFNAEATNFVNNPDLVGSGTWVELRRNLFTNPGFESGNTTGWSSNAGGTGVTLTATTEEYRSGNYSCKVVSEGLGNNRGINQSGLANFPVSTGVTVTASAWVKFPLGVEFMTQLQERTSTGTYIGGETATWVGTGNWQRVHITSATPAVAGNTYTFPVYVATGAVTFYVDDFLFETTNRVKPYFDGATPDFFADPDMRSRWTGAAHASPSILEGQTVTGAEVYNSTAIVIKSNKLVRGRPSVRVITNPGVSPATASGVRFLGNQAATASPFTGAGYIALEAGATNPLRFRGSLHDPFTTIALEDHTGPGDWELRFGSTATNGKSMVISAWGGEVDGVRPDFWVAMPFITGTENYTGPLFSGSMSIPGKITRWLGTVNNSDSQLGTERSNTELALDDYNSVFIPIPVGYQLNMGAFYSSTDSRAGVYYSRVTPQGLSQDFVRMVPLETADENILPDSIDGNSINCAGVRIYIGKTANIAASVTVRAIHARLTKQGERQEGALHWVGGQGHEGTRFVGKPTYITHNRINGGQIEYAATLKEVLY